jgi:hypothetical protein
MTAAIIKAPNIGRRGFANGMESGFLKDKSGLAPWQSSGARSQPIR